MNKTNRLSKKWFLIALVVLFTATWLGVSCTNSQGSDDDNASETASEGQNNETVPKTETTPEPSSESPIPTTTPSDYLIIEGYLKIGRPDLAYNQIQTAIAGNPDYVHQLQTAIPERIESTSPNPTAFDVYSQVLRTGPVWLNEKIKAYVVPILVLLVSILGLYFLVRLYIKNQEIRFDVGQFCLDTQEETGISINVKALVEREIMRFKETSPSNERNVILQPPDTSDVSLETTLITKDVFSLINLVNRVIPPKIVSLSGVLHPFTTSKGCGVTLRLVDHKGCIVDECTLWQSSYDPDFKTSATQNSDDQKNSCSLDGYFNLIKPAALWTFWFITNNYQTDMGRNATKLIKVFGTTNMVSSLWSYAGGIALSKKNKVKAKEHLINSLDLDDSNLQALFNLANLELDATTEENVKELESVAGGWEKLSPEKQNEILISYNDVIKRFVKIITSLKARNEKECCKEFMYIFSLYQLGAIFEYLYIFSNFNDGQDFSDHQLIQEIDKKLENKNLISVSNYFFQKADGLIEIKGEEKNKEGDREKSKKDRDTNSIVEPPCISLVNAKMIKIAYQSNLKLKDYHPQEKKSKPNLSEFENKTYIGFESYNLACHYSSIAGKLYKSFPKSKEVEEYKKKALNYLEIAGIKLFEDPWASIDPSFYPLRFLIIKDRINKPKLPEHKGSQGLDEIEGLKPAYLEVLKVIKNLVFTDDLLFAGATPFGRKYLAKKSKLPIELITEWVKQADLMRIPWVNGKLAKLLIYAGVNSIQELRDVKVWSTVEKLKKKNIDYQLVELLPNVGNLQEWIETAKKLPLYFEPD